MDHLTDGGNCNAMSDSDGDNIWDITISLDSGLAIEYKFSADSWSIQEMNDFTASCTNGDSIYTNRVLVVPGNDTILAQVCWGSCDPCSSGIASGNINDIYIYPNPASDLVNVISNKKLNRVILRDVTGRVIINNIPTSSKISLDISGLSSNMYFIECIDENGTTIKRILVSH